MMRVRILQTGLVALVAFGCGVPPTTIGVRKKGDTDLDTTPGDGKDDEGGSEDDDDAATAPEAQAAAVRKLTTDRAVVIVEAERTLCMQLSAVTASTTAQPCVTRQRKGGVETGPTSGTCTVVGDYGSGEYTVYELSCTSTSGGTCVDGEVSHLVTSLETGRDFVALVATGTDPDGFTVVDNAVAARSMTLHSSKTYCEGDDW
jgi:hypothetical protein